MAKIYELNGIVPVIDPSSFVHPDAILIGDAIVGPNCYVGPGAVMRGDFGRLAFADDLASYTWTYGAAPLALASYPGSLANVTASSTSSGADARLGAYDELALTLGADGELAVRYFAAFDGFVFERRPRARGLPATWPEFTITGTDASAPNTKCIEWGEVRRARARARAFALASRNVLAL